MKKLLLLFCFVSVLFIAHSQQQEASKPTAYIKLFNKTINAQLYTDNESNKVILKKINKGKITITYTTNTNDQTWIRRFWLCDENDNELPIPFESQLAGFVNANVKQFIKATKKGKLYLLYTTSTPTDVTLAASIRVKRVLLTSIYIQ